MRSMNYSMYRNYNRDINKPAEIVVFKNLSEIENVLNKLENIIKENGSFTLADYYKLTNGVVLEDDNKYGWTDLLGCTINIIRHGYELILTSAKHLETVSVENNDGIIFNTRYDAQCTLDKMIDTINAYGYVTLGDMYDLAGLNYPSYAGNKYGWTYLNNIDIVRVRDGYILKLPKAMPID